MKDFINVNGGGENGEQRIRTSFLMVELDFGSQPRGLGFLNQGAGSGLTLEAAQEYIDQNPSNTYIDYFNGCPWKVRFGHTLTPEDGRLYDRDNGKDAFKRALISAADAYFQSPHGFAKDKADENSQE